MLMLDFDKMKKDDPVDGEVVEQAVRSVEL